MWKEGSIKVGDEIFHYWMKQYEEGSEWGHRGRTHFQAHAQAQRQDRLQLRQGLGC